MTPTVEQIKEILAGITQPEITTHLSIHEDSGVVFAEHIRRPLHSIDDLRTIIAQHEEIERLKQERDSVCHLNDELSAELNQYGSNRNE